MATSFEEPSLRPMPRQAFHLSSPPDSPSTTLPPAPATPSPGEEQPSSPTPSFPPRTRSALNLTSSTLFGIFGSGSDYGGSGAERDDGSTSTPFGTGAQTPNLGRLSSSGERSGSGSDLGMLDAARWGERSRRRRSIVLEESARDAKRHNEEAVKRRKFGRKKVPLRTVVGKTVTLAAVGVAYGWLISQLHERQEIAPVRVDQIPHHSRSYLAFWAIVAVVIGWAMPAVDAWWEDGRVEDRGAVDVRAPEKAKSDRRGVWAPEWSDVVRTIGAFVGITFAIRKLPWQSTLQLSLTLALCNPAIWFLLDRSSPGLVFSSTVAIAGTGLCLVINPHVIPAPSSRTIPRPGVPNVNLIGGVLPVENVAVTTWIASVLFFSAICFGNIGRRL